MSDTILIVDDSLTVRMDLAEAFSAEGFRTVTAATAAQAREALAAGDVSLAILDVLLPDGNGVALMQEIRSDARRSAIPILMLSTEAEVRDRIRGLATGSNDYVGKPYNREYVVARARELLGRNAAPVPNASVLVIDDSPTFREELAAALEAHGYRVARAASGEEGLRSAAANRPAAIIVDGVLPGIDGATVVRTLRLDAALRKTPCILLTGTTTDRSAELRALDAGADAFVRKEEDLDMILARVAAVLRGAAGAGGGSETASLLGPKRILAVDDSLTYLDELATTLRDEGYDVIAARSGEEALEMLTVQSVDCILLDVLMPGLGGAETCRRIKGSPAVRDIPLIMLTAMEDREAMIEGLATGADDYVLKSSEAEVLKARVRAQLRRKQLEDESRRIRVELMQKELEAAEARAAKELAETRAALIEQLERKNRELEAFSYAVSHDLRAPLRHINGFARMLQEDYAQALDETGRGYLERLKEGSQRMGELIDAMLALSRVNRVALARSEVSLSGIARGVADELLGREPERGVQFAIQDGVKVEADLQFMKIVLTNLLENAWKFTSKTDSARIEFGVMAGESGPAYFIRDNGAGFDARYAGKLFQPFQRLHPEAEYAGTGIGLATVQRVIDRHGGRIWAESQVGHGATFCFTLGRVASLEPRATLPSSPQPG